MFLRRLVFAFAPRLTPSFFFMGLPPPHQISDYVPGKGVGFGPAGNDKSEIWAISLVKFAKYSACVPPPPTV